MIATERDKLENLPSFREQANELTEDIAKQIDQLNEKSKEMLQTIDAKSRGELLANFEKSIDNYFVSEGLANKDLVANVLPSLSKIIITYIKRQEEDLILEERALKELEEQLAQEKEAKKKAEISSQFDNNNEDEPILTKWLKKANVTRRGLAALDKQYDTASKIQ